MKVTNRCNIGMGCMNIVKVCMVCMVVKLHRLHPSAGSIPACAAKTWESFNSFRCKPHFRECLTARECCQIKLRSKDIFAFATNIMGFLTHFSMGQPVLLCDQKVCYYHVLLNIKMSWLFIHFHDVLFCQVVVGSSLRLQSLRVQKIPNKSVIAQDFCAPPPPPSPPPPLS